MEPLITGPLARALEAGRERCNALFAQARWIMPGLDAAAFARHLRERVGTIVAAVDAVAPERTNETAELLFGISLEMIGKEYPARFTDFLESWGRLLTGLPGHLAQEPRRFAGSVTNALYNLSMTAGGRPRQWVEDVLRLGPLCPDVTVLLEAGKVCAWRAGLAHFRGGALDACVRLPPEVAAPALGLAGAVDRATLEVIVKRLRADPWLDPAGPASRAGPIVVRDSVADSAAERRTTMVPLGSQNLQIMRTVGGFRGFGGPFLRPPRVSCARGQLFVTDGEGCWQLWADLFGATLHRVEMEFPERQRSATFKIGRDGLVTAGEHSRPFEELRDRSSYAGNNTTLAVTVPLSHQVFLIALAEKAP